MASEFSFELIGADAALVLACREALLGFGTIRVSGPEETQVGKAPDATLVCIGIPLAQGITRFAQCRALRPTVPVLLIGEAVDTDIATELIKCGAAEFVTRESVPELLRPRLERTLQLRRGAVLVAPEFEVLADRADPMPGANRRRCFRALARGAVLKAGGRGGEVSLTLEDLSIPTEGWPGGLGALVDDAGLRRLPVSDWSTVDSIPLTLQAPGEPAVAIRARLVSSRRRRSGPITHLAFQYLLTTPASEVVVRRLWLAGQRRAAG